MNQMERKLAEQIRKTFDRDNIDVDFKNRAIQVRFGVRQQFDAFIPWVPYGGGPLYGKSALDNIHWMINHLEKYRDLLPKRVQKFHITRKQY